MPQLWRRAFDRRSKVVWLVVVVFVAAVFVRLGFWQLDRASLLGQPDRPEASLSELLEPRQPITDEALDATVTVSGTYDPQGQLRVLGGAGDTGTSVVNDWVLTPLRVTDGTGQDAVLAVVRGSIVAGGQMPPPPTGTVQLTGRLLVTEPPPSTPSTVDGAVETVSVGELASLWDTRIYSGYLLLASSEPASTLNVVPPPVAGRGWAITNVSYAIQWWIFAGFALFVWWRGATREAVGSQRRGEPHETTPREEKNE